MRVLPFLVSLSLLALTGCGGGKQAAATSAPADTSRATETTAAPFAAIPESARADADTTAAPHAPSAPAAAAKATGADAPSADLGTRVYFQHCVVCHGPEGRGDGPGLLAPDPLPPNFHDQAYMSARTDSMLLRSIRRGKGEAAMPRWDRILTEEEMKAVLGFVRKFANQR